MARNPFNSDEVLVCETHPALFAAAGLFRARHEDAGALAATLIEPSPSGKGVFVIAASGPDLAIAFDPQGTAVAPIMIAGADEVDALARNSSGAKGGKSRLRFVRHGGALFAEADNGTRAPARTLDALPINWRGVLELKEPAVQSVMEHLRCGLYVQAAKLLHKGSLGPKDAIPMRNGRGPGWGPIEISYALNGDYRFSVVARPMRWIVEENLRLCDWVARCSEMPQLAHNAQEPLPSVA